MRVVLAGLVLALGCGQVREAQIGEAAGAASVAGAGTSASNSAGADSPGIGGSGGHPQGSQGGAVGASAGKAGAPSGGSPAATNDQAGGASGAAGEPDESAGAPGGGVGGEATEIGGAGGEPRAPTCDAAHDLVDGQCVLKPECDCAAQGVECSSLTVALGTANHCPIRVDCGTCPTGSLCVVGVAQPRVCMHCDSAAETNPVYNPAPVCPPEGFESSECSAAYSFCGHPVTAIGEACPGPSLTGSQQAAGWTCGPPL